MATRVTTLFFTVHTAVVVDTTVMATGPVLLGATVNVPTDSSVSAIGANASTCAAFATMMLSLALLASRYAEPR